MPNSTDTYRNRPKTGAQRPPALKPVNRRPSIGSARENVTGPAMRGLQTAMKR